MTAARKPPHVRKLRAIGACEEFIQYAATKPSLILAILFLAALRARVIDPIVAAIKLAKETMGSYQARRRREIEEAQRAIEAEARRKADEEKLAQAVVLEQSGNKEAAEIVMAAPAVVQIPKAAMAAVAMPKLANTATRENWMFKLVDPTLASIPLQFLMLDESKVGKLVKSLKGDAQAILGAGILVYSEEGVAGKGGAK